MKVSFSLPYFVCPPNIRPHLEKVFSGEYDIPLSLTAPRILDLGANCGAFSLWARHRWPDSRVEAYEPHPDNFNCLVRNTKGYSNVTLHNQAIGNPGTRILFNGRFNEGEASLHSILNNPHPTGQHVEVSSPLDLPEADIIKLDTEGCEVEILRPLVESGRSFSAVLFEYHSEPDRRTLDALLLDYHLVGATVEDYSGRGVFKYMKKELL